MRYFGAVIGQNKICALKRGIDALCWCDIGLAEAMFERAADVLESGLWTASQRLTFRLLRWHRFRQNRYVR